NTADSNFSYAFYITGYAYEDTFQKNNWFPSPHNPDSAVFVTGDTVFDFRYNYWSTSDSDLLSSKIFGAGILRSPFRTSLIDTYLNADTVAPASPTFTSADTTVFGRVTLNWTKPANEEEGGILNSGDSYIAGYRLYRHTAPDTNDWEQYLLKTINSASDTSYVDTDISLGETYYYKIVSFDSHLTDGKIFYNRSWYSNSIKVNVSQFYDTGSIKVFVSDFGDGSNPSSGDTLTAFPSLFAAVNSLNADNGYDTIVVYSHSSDSYAINDTIYLDTGMLIISKLFSTGYDEVNDTKPSFFVYSGNPFVTKAEIKIAGFCFTGQDSSNASNILLSADSSGMEIHDNLYISNCDFINFYKPINLIMSASNSNCIVKHCNFINCYYAIDGLNNDAKIFKNKFVNILADAVKIYESVKVINNYFENVYNGITYSAGSSDTTYIVNNTFKNISNNALNFTGGVSIKTGVYNNLFKNCNGSIIASSDNDTYFYNNIFKSQNSSNLFNAVSMKNNYYDSFPPGNIYLGAGFSVLTNETGVCPANLDLDMSGSNDDDLIVYHIGYFGDSNPFVTQSNISPIAAKAPIMPRHE
ncbi:MAG TPA: fibronectin type III domain-containing protein, partial [bacterium]|nr:fibronectin type III domain-containing protein [bacterium]